MPQIPITFTDDQLRIIDWRAASLSVTRERYLSDALAALFKDLQELFDAFHDRETLEAFRKLSPSQKQTTLEQVKDLIK